MGCGCGGAVQREVITSNQAQAMLDEALRQRQDELQAMIASAGRAAENADSNTTAQR